MVLQSLPDFMPLHLRESAFIPLSSLVDMLFLLTNRVQASFDKVLLLFIYIYELVVYYGYVTRCYYLSTFIMS